MNTSDQDRITDNIVPGFRPAQAEQPLEQFHPTMTKEPHQVRSTYFAEIVGGIAVTATGIEVVNLSLPTAEAFPFLSGLGIAGAGLYLISYGVKGLKAWRQYSRQQG